jgi:hypothetical protein
LDEERGSMNEMDLATNVKEIILRLNKRRTDSKPFIQLTVPPVLSKFHWQNYNLEKLIEKFLDHISATSHPTRRVRVAVHEKKRMVDLEKFFSIYPAYWFHLSIESQSAIRLEDGTRKILEDLGYRCSEWMGVENSESQLGAFHREAQDKLAVVLYIQSHGVRRHFDFLIPVSEVEQKLFTSY